MRHQVKCTEKDSNPALLDSPQVTASTHVPIQRGALTHSAARRQLEFTFSRGARGEPSTHPHRELFGLKLKLFPVHLIFRKIYVLGAFLACRSATDPLKLSFGLCNGLSARELGKHSLTLRLLHSGFLLGVLALDFGLCLALFPPKLVNFTAGLPDQLWGRKPTTEVLIICGGAGDDGIEDVAAIVWIGLPSHPRLMLRQAQCMQAPRVAIRLDFGVVGRIVAPLRRTPASL